MRKLGIGLGVVVLLAGVGAITLYGRATSLAVHRVSDDVHMIEGFGGNVGVLATDAGAVIVDTMTFRVQGDQIRELAEQLGRGPFQAIVNTHYHQDHTHGNPAFPSGTRVISTRRTLHYLNLLDAAYWEGDAADTLPNDTFDERHELRVGGKTIRSLHLGRGHTDGDLVVLFVEDRVLHTGDLFFHRFYPNIDLEAGASLPAWIETLDRVLALPFDRVIPGHGEVTDRAGIVAFQGFLRELWSQAQAAARAGRGLEETLATLELTSDAGYGVIGVPLVFRLDRDFVVKRAWEEATGSFTPVSRDGPG